MRESDATLVSQVLSGDADVYDLLVRRYQRGVYAAAWAVVRDTAAAEDVTQEVFIAAYQRLSKLRDPAAFASWLRRITVNAARMWIRNRPREETIGDMDLIVDPTERVYCSLNDEISAALNSLPATKREVTVLCYVDGFSRKDAAKFLGLNESTLRKRLHDAKRLLQRQIVAAAEANLNEHLLPKGFEERCICKCRRALNTKRKEKIQMASRKNDCGCGCLPPDKKKTSKKKGRKSRSSMAVPSKKGR